MRLCLSYPDATEYLYANIGDSVIQCFETLASRGECRLGSLVVRLRGDMICIEL